MRKETIRLYSVNDCVLRHVTIRDAFALLNEGKAVPVKNTRREIVAVQLKQLERNERTSPCTLTCSDAQSNAIGAVTPKLRRFARDDNRRVMRDKIGNYIDRAMSKVEAWGPTHDDKAAVISAGVCYGVTCPWPKYQEQTVTFA